MRRGDYKIGKEQMEFLRQNMDSMPRKVLAKTLGISPSTLYSYIKMLGGKVQQLPWVKSEIKEIVRRHYATMTPSELVARFGHSRNTYHHYAQELGIKRTEECQRRLHDERVRNVMSVNPYFRDPEGFRKKMRNMRRMEELRVGSGQPQETKLKVRKYPKRIYKARWQLLNKKNYIEIIDEYNHFAYDGETTRVDEKLYAERYGFEFFDINDIEIEDD